MLDRAGGEPLAQALQEELVGEIVAPQRGVLNARFGQRAVQVQHADETRPLAAPVRDGQDRAADGE